MVDLFYRWYTLVKMVEAFWGIFMLNRIGENIWSKIALSPLNSSKIKPNPKNSKIEPNGTKIFQLVRFI